MKNIKTINLLLLLLTIFVVKDFGQQPNLTRDDQTTAAKCSPNSDALYDRPKFLEQLAEMLNSSIPEYKTTEATGFYIKDERAGKFSIYDLANPSNFDLAAGPACINFINNHIYHVSPTLYSYSFSHIVILEDGKLKIFKSINCKDRGDSLQQVLSYLSLKLKDSAEKEVILKRVKNYRRYGDYPKTDAMKKLQCAEAEQTNF